MAGVSRRFSSGFLRVCSNRQTPTQKRHSARISTVLVLGSRKVKNAMAETSVTFGFRLDLVSARRLKEAAAAAGQDTSTFLRDVVRRGLADGDMHRAVAAEVGTLRAELNGLRTELATVRAQLAREGAEYRNLLKRAVAGLLMATTQSTEAQAVQWIEETLGLD